jgi:NAD(P)-dependent dehydrogenase (short-subunit alcohol dehydrogenase family)
VKQTILDDISLSVRPGSRLFAAEGAKVTVTGTNPKTIEAARLELGALAEVVASDAGAAADIEQRARSFAARGAGVDVLFLNARARRDPVAWATPRSGRATPCPQQAHEIIRALSWHVRRSRGAHVHTLRSLDSLDSRQPRQPRQRRQRRPAGAGLACRTPR